MPHNRHQQQENPAPLLYSSLSTRRSSYLTRLLIVSSPTPDVIKRTDLGNEISQLLISSNRAF